MLGGRVGGGGGDGAPPGETMATDMSNGNNSSPVLSSTRFTNTNTGRPLLPFPSSQGSSAPLHQRQLQQQQQQLGLSSADHHGLDDEVPPTAVLSQQQPATAGVGSGSVLRVFGRQMGSGGGGGAEGVGVQGGAPSLGLGNLASVGLDQVPPLGMFGGQGGVGDFGSGLVSSSQQHTVDPLTGQVLGGLPGLGLDPGHQQQLGGLGNTGGAYDSGLGSMDHGGSAAGHGLGMMGAGRGGLGAGMERARGVSMGQVQEAQRRAQTEAAQRQQQAAPLYFDHRRRGPHQHPHHNAHQQQQVRDRVRVVGMVMLLRCYWRSTACLGRRFCLNDR